jgi:acyl carrier protein
MTLFHAPTIAQFAEAVEREKSLRENGHKFVDLETITHEVHNFIVENYLGGGGEGLKDSDSLLELEIIDPMRLYELVEYLQETHAITIEDEALTGNNFDSIKNISRFVHRKLSGKSGDGASADGGEVVGVSS